MGSISYFVATPQTGKVSYRAQKYIIKTWEFSIDIKIWLLTCIEVYYDIGHDKLLKKKEKKKRNKEETNSLLFPIKQKKKRKRKRHEEETRKYRKSM